jgi:hypothetical protein
MKIQLKEEMETLLIPLYGKAKMSETGIFRDSFAEDAVRKLDYNYSRLKIKKKTQVMLAMRAALIDGFTKNFIKDNPGCLILSLFCTLDAGWMQGLCVWDFLLKSGLTWIFLKSSTSKNNYTMKQRTINIFLHL